MRGRGEFMRGRGEFMRGRGEFMRGRGSPARVGRYTSVTHLAVRVRGGVGGGDRDVTLWVKLVVLKALDGYDWRSLGVRPRRPAGGPPGGGHLAASRSPPPGPGTGAWAPPLGSTATRTPTRPAGWRGPTTRRRRA
eukprot:1193357-Prorocentrum_minimum.AAC.2